MVAALRGRAALVRAIFASIVLVGVLFVYVFPTRAWFGQRNEVQHARSQLELLRHQSSKLEQDARRLQTDDEVERRARELYGMVRPGEEPWAVIPPPSATTATTTPTAAPSGVAAPPR